MDLSNLMMLWNFLLAFYIVYTDVIREDGYHNYEGQFTVKNKGRMLRVLMSFRNVEMEECALHCVRHLRCRTFNYHYGKKDCELTDEEFDEMDAETITHGWYNYGTPTRVNGAWSTWRNFTDCTKTCGSGNLDQFRECDSPKPDHGGAECKGRMRRTVACNTDECKVDGGWGAWKNYTNCSKVCGNGTLVQRRDCDTPRPEHGGTDCSGEKEKTVICNTHECPVNGGWSKWENSTKCTKTCGGGTIDQLRECDSPKPDYGGVECTGEKNRTVQCNTHNCPVVKVALKEAKQSSTFKDDPYFSPSNAIDGDINSPASTKEESNSWLEVEMVEVRKIASIHLRAMKRNPNFNKDLKVETLKSKGDDWILCKIVGDVQEEVTKFKCNEQSSNAKFIKFSSTKSLYIQDVVVFGY